MLLGTNNCYSFYALILSMVLVGCSGSSNSTGNPDTTNPDTTNPDTTNPDTTNPDTTNPDTTNPDTTNNGEVSEEMQEFSGTYKLKTLAMAAYPFHYSELEEHNVSEALLQANTYLVSDYNLSLQFNQNGTFDGIGDYSVIKLTTRGVVTTSDAYTVSNATTGDMSGTWKYENDVLYVSNDKFLGDLLSEALETPAADPEFFTFEVDQSQSGLLLSIVVDAAAANANVDANSEYIVGGAMTFEKQ